MESAQLIPTDTITNKKEHQQIDTSIRNQQLDRLFDMDLEFLQDSGSLDLFYFNEDTGEDGLLHTLIGDETGGFHSESAAQILRLNHPSQIEKTMVDRSHIANKNSKGRAEFKERPFEPFAARIVINGVRKLKSERGGSDQRSREVNNSMYPSEYDPTSIVRAVAQAYFSRDEEKDEVRPTSGRDVLSNDTGWTTMLDGKTRMRIKMFLDPDTKKILTAFPIVQRSGYMGLDSEAVNRHLLE